MADKKISQLSFASAPLSGSEVLPIVQSGSTVKTTVANLTNGRTVDAAEFRLDANDYSKVADPDGGGGFVGGYNISYNGGVKYTQTGVTAGVYYATAGNIQFFAGVSAPSGTIAPEVMRVAASGLSLAASSDLTLNKGTASTALALDASKNVVSVTNTGTGNNVLATSPTLVTPTLGAASATSVAADLGAVGTPSYTFTGDLNTGLWSPAADTLAASTGGAEVWRVNSSGNFSLGATAWTTNPFGQTTEPRFFQYQAAITNVRIASDAAASFQAFRFTNDGGAPGIHLGKARGTYASPSAVQSGDNLGDLQFRGYGGTNSRTLGNVTCFVDTYTSDSNISSYLEFRTSSSGAASGTEKARLTAPGSFKIGGSANRSTTEGDKQLVLFNGTAPVGTLTNGISIYSSSGEAYVMDAAGNATLFSPHDRETNEWIFKSKHTPSGKVLRIDVEKLLRFVNDHFGLDAVSEFIEK